jgi:hypothetical protein
MRPVACIILLGLLCSGCNSGGPFDYVPVSGKVTYEDGSPIPGGCRLLFTALDVEPVGTAHARPGRANVNASGEFDVVTSYKYGDGLVPGEHKVVILSGTEIEGAPVVSKEYTSALTTPLVINTADSPLVIKVPKP